MNAVMYGAGNIGRGFIGALFSQSGYDVTFIDVAEATVDALNRDGQYPVRVVSNEGFDETIIKNVSAVNGRDEEAVAETIANADIMATAVGVNVLKFIAPVIAKGIKKRFALNGTPLNIIICENLIDANKVLEGMIKEKLTSEESTWFDQNIGLCEASIGRMVPVQTPEMQDGNPLRVCVERYGFLPVDKEAFRGQIPDIKNMVPFEPFDYYIRRKLYLHNMGHATCAYLGMLKGCTCIYESIDDAEVRVICQSAMTESAIALSTQYSVPISALTDHLFDLLKRFENVALGDTCARVGADTVRKLNPSDRLIGAATLCLQTGVTPAFIALGAAAALHAHLNANTQSQTEENALTALEEIANLSPEDKLTTLILDLYRPIANGASIEELRKLADAKRIEMCGAIV